MHFNKSDKGSCRSIQLALYVISIFYPFPRFFAKQHAKIYRNLSCMYTQIIHLICYFPCRKGNSLSGFQFAINNSFHKNIPSSIQKYRSKLLLSSTESKAIRFCTVTILTFISAEQFTVSFTSSSIIILF